MVIAGIGVAVSMMALSACSSGTAAPAASPTTGDAWSKVVAAATKEGSVTIYTGQPPAQMDALKAAFQTTYPGIDLEYVRGSSGDMQTRFDQERSAKSGEADVYEAANPFYLPTVEKAGDLVPLTGPNLDDATFTKYPVLKQSKDMVTPLALGFNIIWNTNLVKKPIKGYADLISRASEFKGSIAIPDLTSAALGSYYGSVDAGQGEGYLEKLLATKPQVFATSTPLVQSVVAGESKAGIFADTVTIKQLKSQGAPIKDVAPDKKSNYLAVYQDGIPSWAKHPNAAQVYVNWMLSKEGQKFLGGEGYITALPNISGASGGPQNITLPDPALAQTDFFTGIQSRFNAGLKR
jgi:iron(III) transport system substrate-binding protein